MKMKVFLPSIFFILFISSFKMNTKSTNIMTLNVQVKPEIFYFFDPLCGWCYGMESVMMKIQKEFSEGYNFNIIPGGMVAKSTAQPISNMKDFLINAIPQLESTTGVKIEQPYYDQILNNETVVLNSELPSQAFLLAKKHYKGEEVLLAKKIQDLLYQEGLDISKVESFKEIEGLDINDLNSDIAEDKMNEAFNFTRQLGVTGYPTLLLKHQDKFYKVSSGYVSYEQLTEVLNNFLQQINN